MRDFLTAIGFMSGTSMDGVDVALIQTDGIQIQNLGPAHFYPYDDTIRDVLRQALADAKGLKNRTERPGVLGKAEELVTEAHLQALKNFLQTYGLAPQNIDVLGFHGQTVLHRPEQQLTVQLGLGSRLAKESGIPVVFDFRAADVMAGGQGAPLAPIYHLALSGFSRLPLPLVVVNLGGVANVTWIGQRNQLIAFDTGPANALIDDWVRRHTGQPMDHEGAIARAGKVDEICLRRLLLNPYFDFSPPKSLDRLDFSAEPIEGLSLEDGAATLTAFTAYSLAQSLKHMPDLPKLWVLCGGGARNPELCRMLQHVLNIPGCGPVKQAHDFGWRPDFIEAEAFAYMAVRSLKGMPISFPGTTGIFKPQKGGILVGGSDQSIDI